VQPAHARGAGPHDEAPQARGREAPRDLRGERRGRVVRGADGRPARLARGQARGRAGEDQDARRRARVDGVLLALVVPGRRARRRFAPRGYRPRARAAFSRLLDELTLDAPRASAVIRAPRDA